MIEIDITNGFKNMRRTQNLFGFIAIIVFIIYCFSEALRTEGDSVSDSLVLYMLMVTFYSQYEYKEDFDLKQFCKKIKDYIPYLLIIATVKGSYFFDKGVSLNFDTDPALENKKLLVTSRPHFVSIVGFIGLILLENLYVNRKWLLNKTISSTFLSNILTVQLIFINELTIEINKNLDSNGKLKIEQIKVLGVDLISNKALLI